MLTKPFLIQTARDHGLTPKQVEVFLLKILEDLSYEEIASQIGVSKAACLKRMGDVYEKFGIQGVGRGKEQRLRRWLLPESKNFQVSRVDVTQLNARLLVTSQRDNALKTDINTLAMHREATIPQDLLTYDAWFISLIEWFVCLGFKFEGKATQTNNHCEWIIRIKARRGWDRIVVHGVQGEVQAAHVRTLREAAHKNETEEGWVVAPRRISQIARQEVALPNNDDLFCYTFDELIDEYFNVDQYCQWLEKTVEDTSLATRYIQLSCAKAELPFDDQASVQYSYYREAEGWIDGYIDLWLDDPAKEHISVLGEFGTGKTWFALHYAWQALQKYKTAKRKGIERPRLPLLIQLRNCAKAASIESLILDFFFRTYQIALPDYSVFEQLNRMGKLLIIFDGFDEMATKVDTQSMINNFWQLAKVVVPGSKVILTCRTEHFPNAQQGRDLLGAELKASTSKLQVKEPQFEVLELENFTDDQIRQVILSRADEATAQKFMNQPELIELARRPLMLELILEGFPTIKSGKSIDLARIYLYTVRHKMEKDIKSERTFTSLADKLYFLCELSWEMLSTEQMALSYKHFPDRIRQFFGDAVNTGTELDHWHYDMMGQTMLSRNEHGEYSPAHRSFLEFFVAYKFAAELGCLAPDFVDVAQQQSYVDDEKTSIRTKWSEYFSYKSRTGRVPLLTFSQESIDQLRQTLGYVPLSKAILDLMIPMLHAGQPGNCLKKQLLDILSATKDCWDTEPDYLVGNLITILIRLFPAALQGKDLSHRVIRGADFTDASLRDVDFTDTHFESCIFPQGWSGDLSVAFSPNGQYLAIVDSTGEISLRDVLQEKPVWQKKGHTDWIRALAFDCNGQVLATGSHDKSIKLWDVKTGGLIKSINVGSRVYSVAFSQEQNWLASGGDEQVVRLWNISTGTCMKTLEGHSTWVGAVAFGKDAQGEVLASGSNDGTIRAWEPVRGDCIKFLQASESSIHALAFDSASQKLASGSADNHVKIWDMQTGRCVRNLVGHSDWVRSVSFSVGGNRLVSGGNDRSIKLWNVETGKCIRSIEAHKTRVWSVAFSPNQKMLASGSDDRTIKLWNVDTGECTKTLLGNSRGLWSIAFSEDGQTVYCGSDDHRVQSWHMGSSKNLRPLQGHKGRVRTISLSEKAGLLASGSDDRTIKLWSIKTGNCLKTLENHDDWVWSVDFSPDGQTLASGSLDGTVTLWDMQTQTHVMTLTGHTQFVWSVGWHPIAPIVASGSADQTIRLWDADNGNCLNVLEGHRHQITSISFSSDGTRLASVSDDGEMKVWDVELGECLLTINDNSQLRTVTFSPDGKTLASGGLDKTVRIWDVNTGKCTQELKSHSEPVFSLAFSPTGEILASAGEAGVLHLSAVETGGCLKKLRVDSQYKGMNLTGVTGLNEAQSSTLMSLGAVSMELKT